MNWKDVVQKDLPSDELLGVPFVASVPERYRLALTFEAYELLLGLQALVRDLDEQVKSPRLLRLTRDRLKAFRAANQEHFEILEGLLRPLGYRSLPFSEFNQGLQRRRTGFALMQYYEHLFRDWSWGGAEVQASLDLALKVLPQKVTGNALVLGAGACRFPYELHRKLGLSYSLCVDINPFLLSCAQRLIRGEPLELVEFPTLPVDAHAFAKRTSLTCPAPVGEGFEFLVHDLEEWAFKDGAFDLVVTHWLIDVVPMSPQRLFSLINRALKPGGVWLNIGSVGFNKRTLALYYSREEVLALVEKAELEVLDQTWAAVPYFQNPSSAHWRTEHVLAFAARKKGECSTIESREPVELPEWLEDTQKPVHLPVDLPSLQRSYAFCVDLLGKLGSGPSIDALSTEIARDHGLTHEQAEQLIANTLMQWLDASRHNPMKSG